MTVSSRRIETKVDGTAKRFGGRLTYPNASGRENHASSRGIEARGGFALPATLTISNVTFTVTSTSITVNYDTDQPTQCVVTGKKIVGPPDPHLGWDTWYSDIEEHSPHAHTKTGLDIETSYTVRIWVAVGDTGQIFVYSPSFDGYYIVKTHNAGGTGGGLVEIVP
jgi:hypothetical protein